MKQFPKTFRSILLAVFIMDAMRISFCFSTSMPSLQSLEIKGHFSFEGNEFASRDFGNMVHSMPHAVLHPMQVSDIAATVKYVWEMGPASDLTVVARGHGHSLKGQAQVQGGIVINMMALRQNEVMQVNRGNLPYVDVSGGELWINVLHECLKYGLAPKSWTDYLYLTVGGTLSNAGISGQAFRHGPQISNVHQLEVVTGKGEVVVCSEDKNADLFHGVLGGLGQFGIITRARISLQPAPQKVKWIRVLYSEFSTFARDQENLISAENTFDYIEGIAIINRTGVVNSWKSSFRPDDPEKASQFISDGKTLFCLELAKSFNPDEAGKADKEIRSLLSTLSYIPSTLFVTEVSYVDFLDRVHIAEKNLRLKGMWDLPHPWLNLLVPKSNMHKFAEGVFGEIVRDTSNGPVLVYPLNKSKWDNRTSFIAPDEDIFYLVGFLTHPTESHGLEELLEQNSRVLSFCDESKLGVKQYLPHYAMPDDWRAHFSSRWEAFVQRKSAYDPLSILAPGQRIFQKAVSVL